MPGPGLLTPGTGRVLPRDPSVDGLTLAAFLLTAGSLADMYGRRRLYLAGLVVFTGASALCGFATSTLMLQLSRGLQGSARRSCSR